MSASSSELTLWALTLKYRSAAAALAAVRSGAAVVRDADRAALEQVLAAYAQQGLRFETAPGLAAVVSQAAAAIQSGQRFEVIYHPEVVQQWHEETSESLMHPDGREVGPFDGGTPPTNWAGVYNPEPPVVVQTTTKSPICDPERIEVRVGRSSGI